MKSEIEESSRTVGQSDKKQSESDLMLHMSSLSLVSLSLLSTPGLVVGWRVVSTPDGDIEGRPMISHHRHPFWGFQGIPYAEPPVGDLRWLPPTPLRSKWNGTKDGSVSPPMCVQGFPDPETTHDSLNVSHPPMFGNYLQMRNGPFHLSIVHCPDQTIESK